MGILTQHFQVQTHFKISEFWATPGNPAACACWHDLRIPVMWVSPWRCARQRPGDNATSAAASRPGCHSTWWILTELSSHQNLTTVDISPQIIIKLFFSMIIDTGCWIIPFTIFMISCAILNHQTISKSYHSRRSQRSHLWSVCRTEMVPLISATGHNTRRTWRGSRYAWTGWSLNRSF